MSLVIDKVSKSYQNGEADVLKEISLTVENGEFVCIVGASGCGKSTLLNLVSGLETPTTGEILLEGKKITGPGADRVVMFQEHGLYPWLSVLDNVKFGMKMAGVSKELQEEKAMYYLDMVHLTEYRDYMPHQISGGMRQRTALARALTLDSKMLLMDEPFSALDKQTSNRLREELQRIWMETHRTILFITHSAEEAVYLADRVVALSADSGEIAGIIPIQMPRPRRVYELEFVEYRHQVLDLIKSKDENREEKRICK